MKHPLVLAIICSVVIPQVAVGQGLESQIATCKPIQEDDERLACFDDVAANVPLSTSDPSARLTSGVGTAIVGGVTTRGTLAGGANYWWTVDGNFVEGVVSVSQISHSGAGGLFIDLPDLPHPSLTSTPAAIWYEGLVYSSTPYAFIVQGGRRILIRQSQSGAGFSNVNVPAGPALYEISFRYRWQ